MIYVLAAWKWVKALPEWAWWIVAIIALIVTAFVFDFFNDRAAVATADAKRAKVSVQAANQSAEERADEAIRNVMAEKDRQAAIARAEASEAAKPIEARSTVSAQQHALDCERLRQSGLTSGPNYKEFCQ